MLVHSHNEMLLRKKKKRDWGEVHRKELSIQATTWMNPNALCGLKEVRVKGYILYDSI